MLMHLGNPDSYIRVYPHKNWIKTGDSWTIYDAEKVLSLTIVEMILICIVNIALY